MVELSARGVKIHLPEGSQTQQTVALHDQHGVALLLAAGSKSVGELLGAGEVFANQAGERQRPQQWRGRLATGDLGELRWFFGSGRLQPATTGLICVSAARPVLESHVRARVAALPNVTFI